MVACLLLFAIIHFRKCGRKRRRPESTEGSCHSLPVSMAKDCSSIALEESREASVISSPTTGLRYVPPVRTKVVRVNRRSFSKKSRVPIGAKLHTVTEMELATNNFGISNFLGEGSNGTVYKVEFPDGQVGRKCINKIY